MNPLQIIGWIAAASVLSVPIGAPSAFAQELEAQPEKAISSGNKVSLELTLSLADKTVFFSNVGSKPLLYTHGSQEVVRGLETALEGMHVGEQKHVTVPPSEGFGVVLSENFHEVPKDKIPPDLLKEGAELQGEGPHGEPVFFRVAHVKEETVILDFNHPLAGKTLYFDVKVLDIK